MDVRDKLNNAITAFEKAEIERRNAQVLADVKERDEDHARSELVRVMQAVGKVCVRKGRRDYHISVAENVGPSLMYREYDGEVLD